MSLTERDLILAEIDTLEGFLRELDPARVVERMGFEARLERARARLSLLERMDRAPNAMLVERGRVTGILPAGRRFECVLADGRTLSGKLDRGIADALAFKHTWEDSDALLVLRETRVRQSKRFVLVEVRAADTA